MAGTPRSVAVLVRICFTRAGDGRGAVVGFAIGLDDQRRGAGGQGRRLAGAAGFLDVGGLAHEVGAAGEERSWPRRRRSPRSPGATRSMVLPFWV